MYKHYTFILYLATLRKLLDCCSLCLGTFKLNGNIMTAKIISFEAVDGAGKATQAEKLVSFFQSRRYKAV